MFALARIAASTAQAGANGSELVALVQEAGKLSGASVVSIAR